MRNALRNDRGAGSLEYLGIIIVALVTVGAIIAAVGKFDLGEKIACQVQQLGTAQASCAGGGSSDAPTQADRAPRGQQPAGVANPGEGNDQKGETHSSSGGAQYYRGATNRGQDVDTANVEHAADAVRDKTRSGFWFINKTDHSAIKSALSTLNGTEIDAVFAELSDEEIRQWVSEIDGGWGRGPSEAERAEIWDLIEKKASRETLERLRDLTGRFEVPVGTWEGQSADIRDAGTSEIDHKLFIDGVSIDHVYQGALGDCWALASMMGFADADPQLIEDAITLNENGTYTVRLYKDGEPVYYTVTPDFVVDENGKPQFAQPAYVKDPDGVSFHSEAWPLIMEKALAEHFGDEYADIHGGWPYDAMEALTGTKSEKYKEAPSIQELERLHESGAVISPATVFDDKDETSSYGDPYEGGLIQAHAYVVTGVDAEADLITLENPWGTHLPTIEMSYSEFSESFSRYDVNEGQK